MASGILAIAECRSLHGRSQMIAVAGASPLHGAFIAARPSLRRYDFQRIAGDRGDDAVRHGFGLDRGMMNTVNQPKPGWTFCVGMALHWSGRGRTPVGEADDAIVDVEARPIIPSAEVIPPARWLTSPGEKRLGRFIDLYV
jgi:hypothetical protein